MAPPKKAAKFRKGHKSEQRILQNTNVYLMANVPLVFLCKFGITDNQKARVKNVSETTPGKAFTLISLEVPFGYKFEQFIHSVYSWQNVRLWRGSGKTEWFLTFSPVVGTVNIFLCALYGWDQPKEIWALLYIQPLVWLDGLLWLIFFKLSSILFFVGIIAATIYLSL